MKKIAMFAVGFAIGFSSLSFAADTPMSLSGTEMVDAAKAKTLIAAGALPVDFRVAAEYADSHIKGAINVPYKEKSAKAVDFDASLDKVDLSALPADKNAAIVAYCNGPECWKGYKGAESAVKAGYKKVYWFRGGLPEWKAAGGAVE
ncbi:MAG: rhodanese-like domain-containing protein [Thiotrichales bacterium]|jgi:rhodanese-related sulfurtransferase|nr:rhodanese-like domain-containing protein [Thiotrichales bacterium]